MKAFKLIDFLFLIFRMQYEWLENWQGQKRGQCFFLLME